MDELDSTSPKPGDSFLGLDKPQDPSNGPSISGSDRSTEIEFLNRN